MQVGATVGIRRNKKMNKALIVAGIALSALIFAVTGNRTYAQEVSQEQTQQSEQVIVEVDKGDSLSKIANAHSSTYQRLFYANVFIAHPDVIHPGEQIRIPSADEELVERPLPANTVHTVEKANKTSNTSSRNKQQTKPKHNSIPVVSGDTSVWERLAACESGGNWSINTGNGYYGGLQFSAGTWRSVGGSGLPSQASKQEQITRGQMLQARSGWGQWPACSSKLGLR